MTKVEIEENVKKLYTDHTYTQIGEKLGVSNHRIRLTITNLQRRGELFHKRERKYTKDYALYKGDDLVIVGKLDEISDFTGLTPLRLKTYGSPAYRKKCKKGMVLLELDDE